MKTAFEALRLFIREHFEVALFPPFPFNVLQVLSELGASAVLP
jgi:hypothetical protein